MTTFLTSSGRDYVVNGETLVLVKGGAHMSGGPIGDLSQLGLSADPIRITPIWKHHEIPADDFGPDVPAELLWMLAEVRLSMNLVHYDPVVLSQCKIESMGQGRFEGRMAPAGRPMGGMRQLHASGCHYISVNLTSPVFEYPWRFRACVLTAPPLEMPLSVERSIVRLNWRAIPYVASTSTGVTASGSITVFNELVSSGATLWDHTADV